MIDDELNYDALLNDNVLSELGLHRQPFEKKITIYKDTKTEEILKNMEQLLLSRKAYHLLIGDKGAGKTTLLTQLVKKTDGNIDWFIVKGSKDLEAEAFLQAVILRMDSDVNTDGLTPEENYSQLVKSLSERKLKNPMVLCIHEVDDVNLEEVYALIQVVKKLNSIIEDKTIQMLLICTAMFDQVMRDYEKQQDPKNQFNLTRWYVPGFDKSRTRSYLLKRLVAAGYEGEFPFSDYELHIVHSESQGLPGKINHTAANILNSYPRRSQEEPKDRNITRESRYSNMTVKFLFSVSTGVFTFFLTRVVFGEGISGSGAIGLATVGIIMAILAIIS